ncbi:uracil-DNA glycosylase [Acidithiobacillus caldus]|uniref:Type-4 uracil-DNA glycosylase n=1 Tax=Acidithiobacillus caldus TaxID=33059 RepID=A0A1E7YKM6_9PROT|nr:uracil-DNA glycosylase [Acidithiobacillus caldus]OFC30559.1 uracil-DNA glycosylase [Acidithiobacillus caldus]OFC36441.1 uracil-DNA glycosylase [Acidithiobacillus caldus]OFC38985.1 uracil-DNA glycosylase [Acidithiobacillus caldus]
MGGPWSWFMNRRQRLFFEVLGLDLAGFPLPGPGTDADPRPTALAGKGTPSLPALAPVPPIPEVARSEPKVTAATAALVIDPASAEEQEHEPLAVEPMEVMPADRDQVRRQAISAMDWQALKERIETCRACSLGSTRQNAVVGAGSPEGSWCFVGEAPGAEEDRRGEAFVGRGGQLLDAMLAAMSLSRAREVYIANVLKCRPPNNRDPLGPEVRSCLPYLERQIALVQPRILVALGRFAAQSLLQTSTPIGQLRGRVWEYRGIPLVVTYHPAYLLRNPLEKRKVWEDLKLALSVYPKD